MSSPSVREHKPVLPVCFFVSELYMHMDIFLKKIYDSGELQW